MGSILALQPYNFAMWKSVNALSHEWLKKQWRTKLWATHQQIYRPAIRFSPLSKWEEKSWQVSTRAISRPSTTWCGSYALSQESSWDWHAWTSATWLKAGQWIWHSLTDLASPHASHHAPTSTIRHLYLLEKRNTLFLIPWKLNWKNCIKSRFYLFDFNRESPLWKVDSCVVMGPKVNFSWIH